MLSRRYAAAFLLYLAVFVVTLYVYAPQRLAHAADKKCSEELAYDTQCGKDQLGKDGKPTGLKGGLNCPCQETDEKTNSTIVGKCNAKVQCIGDKKETKDAEGRPIQTCDAGGTGSCTPGTTNAPGSGSPPNVPSPGSGSGGGAPQPDKTPQQKVDEGFKDLQPKPDLKPGEQEVRSDITTLNDYCKQYSGSSWCNADGTPKDSSATSKDTSSGLTPKTGTSLFQGAFNPTSMSQTSPGFFNTDIQPGSVLNPNTTDSIQKLDDSDISVGEFQPTSGLTEQQRFNAGNTFTPQPDAETYDEANTKHVGPSRNDLFEFDTDSKGAYTKVKAVDPNMSDEDWNRAVKFVQNDPSYCPPGNACLMVNNEKDRELNIAFSNVKPGGLQEGAVVINPDSNALCTSSFMCSVTGRQPTPTEVAQTIYDKGIPVTMPDGSEKVMRLTPEASAAIAPTIARTFDSNETSFFGRTSAYFTGDKPAEASFAPRQEQTTAEPEQPPAEQERTPTRVQIYPEPRETPVEVVDAKDAPPAPKLPATEQPPAQKEPEQQPEQQPKTPMPASRPPEAPAREPSTEEKPAAKPPVQPVAQPGAQPGAQPAAQPAPQPAAQPAQPAAQPSPSPSPSAPSPSQSQPQQQASSDANLMQRLYCLIFTCQAPQQQATQQPTPQQPAQQQPNVAQNQPTPQPSEQQPTEQQPTRTTPTNKPTPTQQPSAQPVNPLDQNTQPASAQPPQPTPTPSRENQTRLASSGTNNAFPPTWTQTPSAQPAPNQPAAPSTQSGSGAPAGSNGQSSASASSKPAPSPIKLNTAPAQLVAQANANAAAQASAPKAQQPKVGEKDPVLAVEKAVDPKNTVPAKAAANKPDPAANNPNAGGTAGSPNAKDPKALDVKTAEPTLTQAPDKAGGNEKKPLTTPNPETKKPTTGPADEGKKGTGGTGTGNGSGTGNGNGSEAGVQDTSTCGTFCRANKLLQASLNAGREIFGIKPAIGAPTPTATDAKQQIDQKMSQLNDAMAEAKALGKTEAALVPLEKALGIGRQIAEIANSVNDPQIKAQAGDLNKKVLELQKMVSDYRNLSGFAWISHGLKMESEMPVKIPAAVEAVKKVSDSVSKYANNQQPTPGKEPAPMGNPSTVSRPPASTNVDTPAPAPAPLPAPTPAQRAAAARAALKGAADAFNTPEYRAGNWQKLRSEALHSDLVGAVYNVRDQKPITDAQQKALQPYLSGKNSFVNGTIQNKSAAESEFTNLDRYISHVNDDWCAGTVAAVMNKVADGKVPNYIYVDDFYKSMKESGTLHPKGDGYQPQPMDLFFTPKGGDGTPVKPLGSGYTVRDSSGVLQPGKSQISGHVGFVASYDPQTQTVTTIEGNASGQYTSLKRPLSQIMAFGDTTSFMEKAAPGSVQGNGPTQAPRDPKAAVVVPKNAPNIPGAYNPASGAQLINAANTVCKVIGCNAQTAAQALGGVVGIESEGNAQIPHPGSPYQGYGQLGTDETNRALNKLREIASAPGLSADEKNMMNDVLRRADALVASGNNPNADTHVGPWLLAGLHAEQGTLAKATSMTSDPRLAAAYMMNAQFAPSMMKFASYGPNAVLPPNAVAAYNKQGGLFVPMGATVAEAAQQVLRWRGERIDKGIAMINGLASGADYVPYTGGTPVACGYKGCATSPTIEPGKDGRTPGIQRASACEGTALCAQSAHTGAVYTSNSIPREQFTRAAREEEAMERLAQAGKLPDGANFRDFKAVQSNKDVVNPLTAIAKSSGHPVIPGAKVESWFPMSDISSAPRRDAIISHQSGGPWGSGLNTAKSQTYSGVHSLGTEWWVLSDGTILHTRPEVDTAHIGVNKPPDARHLMNDNTVGIEFEGQVGQKLSPQQIEAGKKLMQYLQERYNLPASAVYRHGKGGGVEGLEMERITRQMDYKPGTGVPAYNVTDANGETVARDVPLDPRSVGGNGDVRLLSGADGKPLAQDGTPLKDGTAPMLVSSDATLPKASQDPQNPNKLNFDDERPDRPAEPRRGYQSPYTRDWTNPTNRPTSTCVNNDGTYYACTPTGGSNPTGGTAPGGGGAGGGAPMSSQQQYPRQYPIQQPYPYQFPPVIPAPNVVPPLSPSLSCTPSSVPAGTSTPVTVKWSCLTGTASSTGFTANTPTGKTTINSSRTSTSTIRFMLQCVDGVRVSPTALCSIPVVTPPTPSVSLSADPNPINAGQSAVLIWGSTNALRCSIQATSSLEFIDGSTNGSTSTPPLYMNTPITLRCMNASGVVGSTTITIRVR